MNQASGAPPRLRVRLTWFALIWTCSVLGLALVAALLRLLLNGGWK